MLGNKTELLLIIALSIQFIALTCQTQYQAIEINPWSADYHRSLQCASTCPEGQGGCVCTDCAAGYYANADTNYVCTACKYSGYTGATNCQPGYTSAFTGKSTIQNTWIVDGQGTAASFTYPSGLAVDSTGNLYVADLANFAIRKMTLANDKVTTLAGNGKKKAVDGTGTAASFYEPRGVAVDTSNNIFVADNYLIRKITSAGVVTTIAGSSTLACTQTTSDDGVGTAACFLRAYGIANDASGTGYLYVAEYDSGLRGRIRQLIINKDGLYDVSTLYALSGQSYAGGPTAITTNTAGDVYYATSSSSVGCAIHVVYTVAADEAKNPLKIGLMHLNRRKDAGISATALIDTAFNAYLVGTSCGYNDGYNGAENNIHFNQINGLAYDPTHQRLYINDYWNFANGGLLRYYDFTSLYVVTVSGVFSTGISTTLTSTDYVGSAGIVYDAINNNLFVSSLHEGIVKKFPQPSSSPTAIPTAGATTNFPTLITPTSSPTPNVPTVFVGNDFPTFEPSDSHTPTVFPTDTPTEMPTPAVTSDFPSSEPTESTNFPTIEPTTPTFSPTYTITTYGDYYHDGTRSAASFRYLRDIVFVLASDGNTALYVADSGNKAVRGVGIIKDKVRSNSYNHDFYFSNFLPNPLSNLTDQYKSNAAIETSDPPQIMGVTYDSVNEIVYVACLYTIMKLYCFDSEGVTCSSTVIAGIFLTDSSITTSIDGFGTAATFIYAVGVAYDRSNSGFLYVAEYGGLSNSKIRKIYVKDGGGSMNVTTVVLGSTANKIYNPVGITTDTDGIIYVGGEDCVLSKIDPTTLVVTNLYGTYQNINGNFFLSLLFDLSGTTIPSNFEAIYGLDIDDDGNIYLANPYINTVRKYYTTNNVLVELSSTSGASDGKMDGYGSAATLSLPMGVAVDSTTGILYVAEYGNSAVRKISTGCSSSTQYSKAGGTCQDIASSGTSTYYLGSEDSNIVYKNQPSTLNSIVYGQVLSGVDCEEFKNNATAQSVFTQAVEKVLSNYSMYTIKATIETDGITCTSTTTTDIPTSTPTITPTSSGPTFQQISHPLDRKLMKTISSNFVSYFNNKQNPSSSLPLIHRRQEQNSINDNTESILASSSLALDAAIDTLAITPTVDIEYLLSWTVPSTQTSIINAVFAAISTSLKDSISTAQFDTVLQNIAQQFGISILYTASTLSFANLTDLQIQILDLTTSSPTAAPNSDINDNKSNNSLSDGAIAGIVIGVLLAVAICILIAYFIYRKKQQDKDGSSSYSGDNMEKGLNEGRESSTKGMKLNGENPIATGDRGSGSSGIVRKMQKGGYSHFIGHSVGASTSYGGSSSYTDTKQSASTFGTRGGQKVDSGPILIPEIKWTDVSLKGATLAEAVIGKGSFGSVVLARLTAKNENEILITNDDVVVKVMTKSLGMSRDVNAYEKNLNIAIQEVSILMDAESKIVYKDCIIKVYGIASGPLSQQLCETLNVSEEAAVVGIVMRLESGGSLDALIHPKPSTVAIPNKEIDPNATTIVSALFKLDMKDKLRMLTGIARGLAELHTAGIVHGDIKPDNVLLSSTDYTTAEVRLADFGLAAVKEQNSVLDSSLAETAHFRGTPLYCAPEMLIDPYAEVVNDKVARPSRKTDVYAFAILAWEVLTEKKPFSDIKNESVLCMKVHQGYRPSPDDFPENVPNKIKNLIIACWDSKRSVRRSAVECYSTLRHYYGLVVNTTYDVYLTYHMDQQVVVNYVFNRLSQNGLNVCLVNKTMPSAPRPSDNIEQSQEQNVMIGVSRAKIIVACIDESFQDDESCLYEVREARKLRKNVVPLFTQVDVKKWINGDIDYACQMKDASTVIFDASAAVNDSSWTSDDGPTQSVIHMLNTEVDKMTDHLFKQIKSEHF